MRPTHIEDYLVSLHLGEWFGWSDPSNKVYANLIIHDEIYDIATASMIPNPYTKPTEQECIDGLAQLQAEYDQAITDKENNKISAKSKLAALGLTEAEIKDTFGL